MQIETDNFLLSSKTFNNLGDWDTKKKENIEVSPQIYDFSSQGISTL